MRGVRAGKATIGARPTCSLPPMYFTRPVEGTSNPTIRRVASRRTIPSRLLAAGRPNNRPEMAVLPPLAAYAPPQGVTAEEVAPNYRENRNWHNLKAFQ